MVNAKRIFELNKVDSIEKYLFLEGIFLRYGYDFRQYAEASLDRRLQAVLIKHNLASVLDLLKKALHSTNFFEEILPDLTVNTTEFFRDPHVFLSLREKVLPLLKTYPRIVVWVAGCSTGEEVISLNILLKEEGLLERTTIYATDISSRVLKQAKQGIFELASLGKYNKNYALSGGTCSPSDYYITEYGLAKFDPKLLNNVVFSEHNLVTDSRFIEAHLILCRNVLIYFNKELQNRVFGLFANSLVYKGFLTIGSKESLKFSPNGDFYEPVDMSHNIYSLKLSALTFRNSYG